MPNRFRTKLPLNHNLDLTRTRTKLQLNQDQDKTRTRTELELNLKDLTRTSLNAIFNLYGGLLMRNT